MRTLAERFWPKVEKTETCWLWKGAKQNGYGILAFHGKRIYAHRVAWIIHYGSIPEGGCLAHVCAPVGRRDCVNPTHVWLGARGSW